MVEVNGKTESLAEAMNVLLNPKIFSSADVLKARPSMCSAARDLLAAEGVPYLRTLIDNDGDDHARFRQIVAPFFTNSRTRVLREPAERFVQTTIDRLRPSGEMELVSEIASQLPIALIGIVFGIPMSPERARQIKTWCDDWMTLQSGSAPENELLECATSYLHLQRFMREAIESHDAEADDLLGALVRASHRGELNPIEQIRLAMGVLVAGHETTTLGIANAVVAFIEHPEYHDSVRVGGSERRAFVDEALRLDPPVRLLFRRVSQRVVVGDIELRTGDRVAVDYASANRDQAGMGADAQDFHPGSAERTPHISFGRGAHACPGSALARLEIDLVLGELSTLPGLRFSEPPRRRPPHASLDGWSYVPLTWNVAPC
jgi:cytochrome P450